MSDLLTAVKRAAAKRQAANQTYRAAILAAREGGHTMPEIGAAAGTGKQAVWNFLNYQRPDHGKGQKT